VFKRVWRQLNLKYMENKCTNINLSFEEFIKKTYNQEINTNITSDIQPDFDSYYELKRQRKSIISTIRFLEFIVHNFDHSNEKHGVDILKLKENLLKSYEALDEVNEQLSNSL
jgi:hypothetical protein